MRASASSRFQCNADAVHHPGRHSPRYRLPAVRGARRVAALCLQQLRDARQRLVHLSRRDGREGGAHEGRRAAVRQERRPRHHEHLGGHRARLDQLVRVVDARQPHPHEHASRRPRVLDAAAQVAVDGVGERIALRLIEGRHLAHVRLHLAQPGLDAVARAPVLQQRLRGGLRHARGVQVGGLRVEVDALHERRGAAHGADAQAR
mmetsp:Transcript_7361/g.26307  ORF Transcript_7361/g.26307 Transcript_7361/m.26307 type:complete len:205 (-) Transcript_7361:1052-1666(-)